MNKIVSINPTTKTVNGEFSYHSKKETDFCLKNAINAFESWKLKSINERASYLRNVSKVLNREKEALATIITIEMGKPIKQSLNEIEKCIQTIDYFVENTENLISPILKESDSNKSYICFQPIGPILFIKPWNFPFWQVLSSASYTIISGNVILLKHSNNVPMCSKAIEDIFKESGIPDGVFQTIMVSGEHASRLISSNEIKGVSFTGSDYVGESIAEISGRFLKKSVLELGGSDPFIVLENSDVEKAALFASNARFLNCGQVCISAKRIILEEPIKEEFINEFLKNIENMKIGNPLEPSTDIGPMANEAQLGTINNQVSDALAKGAENLLQKNVSEFDGLFYPPTVLAEISTNMKVYNEETFGPVAALVTARNEDDCIKIANDTKFGLSSTIWCYDENKALRLASLVEAGMVGINTFFKPDPSMPFGGIKRSGIGRELSKFGIYEFMNIKSIKHS